MSLKHTEVKQDFHKMELINVSYLIAIFLVFGICNGINLTFSHQQATPANDNVCGILRCQQSVNKQIASVLAVEIVDVARRGTKLLSVSVLTSHQPRTDSTVILKQSHFSTDGATVELFFRSKKDCAEGEFLCEVRFISSSFSVESVLTVTRPAGQNLPVQAVLNNFVEKLEDLLSSQSQRINESLESFQKLVKSDILCPNNILKSQWKLAFRGTAGINKSMYSAYKDGTGIPVHVESGCQQLDSSLPCTHHYRNNDILDNWGTIDEVAFVLYKNNTKVKHVLFDGSGSTYLNWFDRNRVKDSSWTDLKTKPANYFSIIGETTPSYNGRKFFINHSYNGCPNDIGWFVAIDNQNGVCPWEQNEALPVFLYAQGNEAVKWTAGKTSRADVLAIFVRYFNIP
ncbi:unnamed protein product [Lymnaea stagnalis]|uniref:Uncharacterized protein n=1 Tax=Lymnaea stagnalis TaxID=6523 RepID=A0AAV2HPH0_LYMST